MYSPQQEIFTECLLIAKTVHDNVYDFLPFNDVGYPFIFIGEATSQDKGNKTNVTGKVQQTIHIYHNDSNQRGTVENLIVNLKYKLRELQKTQHFYLQIGSVTSRVITDNSTDIPLIHAILEVEYRFY